MNLYEIHSHTSEVSGCSSIDGVTLVNEHKKEEFTGVCITDHFFKGYFEQFEGKSDKYKIDQYLSGYRAAKKQGDKIGLQVFLGMEIRFNNYTNDYLVFGITEQFLYDNPTMYNMTVESFSKFIKGSDMMIIWAHPFRDGITMKNHNNFEAIETFNGNIRAESRNYLAKAYANEHGLIGTCGSDYHRYEDINVSPMLFDNHLSNEQDLVKAIRNKEFTHKINYWSDLNERKKCD